MLVRAVRRLEGRPDRRKMVRRTLRRLLLRSRSSVGGRDRGCGSTRALVWRDGLRPVWIRLHAEGRPAGVGQGRLVGGGGCRRRLRRLRVDVGREEEAAEGRVGVRRGLLAHWQSQRPERRGRAREDEASGAVRGRGRETTDGGRKGGRASKGQVSGVLPSGRTRRRRPAGLGRERERRGPVAPSCCFAAAETSAPPPRPATRGRTNGLGSRVRRAGPRAGQRAQ
jgi:hypothetical protein